MEFIKEYKIDKLLEADYNPRKINENSFELLKESLKNFGTIKPLIVNSLNNTIIAGHQRFKALKSIGYTTAPVIKIKSISQKDEIMFNLFHNSIETSSSKVSLSCIGDLPFGYNFITPKYINIRINSNPMVVKELSKLIIKYENWGSIICDENGTVVLNSEYAIACKLLNMDLLVYKMKNSDVKRLKKYLNQDYGQYYYDNLDIRDYNQTFCQMNRLSGEKFLKSTTYTNYVLPVLDKNTRVLDFGAGKCAYPMFLKNQGYKIFMYEPFIRKEKSHDLDIDKVVSFITEINNDLIKNGLYDIVILDSVLNSITSQDMQHNVLQSANAFLKDSGKLIIGTRSLGKIISGMQTKQATNDKRELEFLDKDNFSITFRNGVWTKQRFTTKAQLKKELLPYFNEVEVYGNETRSNIYAICKKPKRFSEEEYRKALNIELNMEYPNDYRHNRHTNLVTSILKELF